MSTEEKLVEGRELGSASPGGLGGEVVSALAEMAVGEKDEAGIDEGELKSQEVAMAAKAHLSAGEEDYVEVEAEEKEKERKGSAGSSSSDEAGEGDDARRELAEDGDGDDEGEEDEEDDDDDDDDDDEEQEDKEEEEEEEEEYEDGEGGLEEEEGDSEGTAGEDDSEGELEEVVVLTCVLNQPRRFHRGRKIWRRIVVPAEFSLLELHVALQNAFDWEDSHLHSFCQPRQNPFPNVSTTPSGYGRTDPSCLLSLDLDSLEASQVRTYQSVVGTEDPYGEVLVPAETENKDGSIVFIQYPCLEEPVADQSGATQTARIVVKAGIKQIMEERAFRIGDILSEEQPILMYEYDFGESHEVTIAFGGKYLSTEGVNYPTCLAGAGASRVEDGNDMDEDGNLLPSYNYDEFAVAEVIRKFQKTYDGLWPAGPGAEDQTQTVCCYMCRYCRDCFKRACSGTCCHYCLKSPIAERSGRLCPSEADAFFREAETKVLNSGSDGIVAAVPDAGKADQEK